MSEFRGSERRIARSAYAKDRLLTADLTDIGEMLDVYTVPEDVRQDPEILTAMRTAINGAEARIHEWQAEGTKIDQDSLSLPDKIRREFGIQK